MNRADLGTRWPMDSAPMALYYIGGLFMVKSIMVKLNDMEDVSALHIVGIFQTPGDKVAQIQMTTGKCLANCDKAEMKRRIDAAWEGR